MGWDYAAAISPKYCGRNRPDWGGDAHYHLKFGSANYLPRHYGTPSLSQSWGRKCGCTFVTYNTSGPSFFGLLALTPPPLEQWRL